MTTAYAAMEDALLVVEDVEGEPRATETLRDVGERIECVAAHPEAPERVLCGTFRGGLRRSEDGGETWERVRGIGESVMSVTASPHDPAEVWAGTEPSAVYRSADGGRTWTERPGLTDLPSADQWYFPPRPDTHHVRWIEVDPDDPDRLYVGIETGAFVLSTDGGETWRERPPGSRRDNHSLATHPDAPGRVYAAAGDGYAESTDAGESFEHPQAGLDHRYCWSVAPDPHDPDTVVMSSASGPGSAHSPPGESYVYRRQGAEWERVGEGLPTGEGVLRAVLDTHGEFYAVNNYGLYRSGGGETWARVDAAWPDRFERQAPRGLAVV